MWTTLLHFFGIEPRTPSTAYNFWSGFGSDIGEVTIIGGLIVIWRHLRCHEPGCKRLGGRHVTIDGCTYKVCHRHHPHHGDRTGTISASYHARTLPESQP